MEEQYMRRAIDLAKQGLGWTSPNPMVGAVIVKDGRVIGEGYHHRCGQAHAERNALANCEEDPAGAAIYVTLEPCCHTGRQPPCTQAILEAGISRVVIGSRDPNPKVAGGGVKLLRDAGIEVTEDFLREECDALNPVFFHYITEKTPYVAMKYAMTADGKIAAYNGASKWITGAAARNHVHQLRHRYTGIMAGIGTILADDPLLNCRMEGGRQPVRILCDSKLRIPLTSQICRTAQTYRTIVACSETHPEKQKALEDMGITVLVCPGENGTVHLPELMQRLGAMEIDSILLEGGGTLNESMLQAGLIHKVYAYVAPKLLGGREAKTPVEGRGFDSPETCPKLCNPILTQLGEDILLEYEVK